jgi:hypothetical protein
MAKSDKKYADPTNVLNCVTDTSGQNINIGDQCDIGEFNGVFLSRIEEGLNYKRIYEEAKVKWDKGVSEAKAHEEAAAVEAANLG